MTKIPQLLGLILITPTAIYKWKDCFVEIEAIGVKKLKELQEENSRLKRIYEELSLVYQAIKMLCQKKTLAPAEKDVLVQNMIEEHGVSQRQTFKSLRKPRKILQYQPKTKMICL